MTALCITPEVEEAARQATAHAEAHPVSIEQMRQFAELSEAGDEVDYGDHMRGVVIPMGFSARFTIEEQPMGLCRHLSVATEPGKLPIPIAMDMILPLFGFQNTVESGKVMTWVEDVGTYQAVNVLEVIIPVVTH